jgi:hypothetical protein
VRFFTLKRFNPEDIHMELLLLYEPNILALSTVYKWHQRFINGRTKFYDNPRSRRPSHNDLAQALSALLQQCPFTSCKRLCVHFRIGKATCLCILHDVLYREKFTLRWVPHSLDNNQKAERVTFSHRLLEALKKDGENNFHNILTGDESCFISNIYMTQCRLHPEMRFGK